MFRNMSRIFSNSVSNIIFRYCNDSTVADFENLKSLMMSLLPGCIVLLCVIIAFGVIVTKLRHLQVAQETVGRSGSISS